MGKGLAELEGKNVLVTGGLGMIGSTLVHKLVRAKACVTIADSRLEPYGANEFNVHELQGRVEIHSTDIRDREGMGVLVKNKDIIFNLAAQVSHNDSIDDPFLDAGINYLGHLNVLENLRHVNPQAVILHAGSRLQFGRIQNIPVDENHPLNPRTPYALNKTAAENMYRFYHEMYGIPCVLFRIANPYGPRSQMKHSKYSMVNWMLRQAMENKTIRIFGSGEQIRDYIYVDDLAEAFLQAAVTPACRGQVYNVGSGVGTTFKDMVQRILDTVGSGSVQYVPWPENYVNVETGDYVTHIEKFKKATGWFPLVAFKEGVQKTFDFYKAFGGHYGL